MEIKLPSLNFLARACLQVALRFPLPLAAAVTATIAAFLLIKDDDNAPLRHLLMTGTLALPLLIVVRAVVEEKGLNRWWEAGLNLIASGLLVLYYFQLDTDAPVFPYIGLPRYFALWLIVHLVVAVGPYLNRRPTEDFWEYNKQLFANIIIGAVYTLILFVGLSLAILAVNALFDLSIDDDIYPRLFVVLAGIFNTLFFLYHFPVDYGFEREEEIYTAIFKTICRFILIPIVALYFLILYTYSAKILLTWTLPRGWVSSLIIGFSVAGVFTYLLNYGLTRSENTRSIGTFNRWFWWVLFPMTLLLFAGIGRRLSDYGLTEERYIVIATGLWLCILSFYFIVSKKDNLKFIPLLLILFLLQTFFGVYNAFETSYKSQFHQLQTLLERNGRWVNGQIQAGSTKISKEDSDALYSILSYLGERNQLNRLASLLPSPLDTLAVSRNDRSGARAAYQLAEWLNPGFGDAERLSEVAAPSRRSVTTRVKTRQPVDIRGFSQAYHITVNLREQSAEEESAPYFFQLNKEGDQLEWREKTGETSRVVESFDLKPGIKRWYNEEHSKQKASDPAWQDIRGRKADLRIVLYSATLDSDHKINYLDAMVFVRNKQ